MKRQMAVWTAVLWLSAAAFPVQAHHSYPTFFDLCTRLTIEGRIASMDWKDPHVMIHLTLDDGTPYRAEWTSLRGLANTGVTADVLKPGDRITVTGSPFRNPPLTDAAGKPYVSDPTAKFLSALGQIRRASDGWNWGRERTGPPSDCVRNP